MAFWVLWHNRLGVDGAQCGTVFLPIFTSNYPVRLFKQTF